MSLLDDFTVEVLSFELRFHNAYLLWDHAGALAQRVTSHEPALRFLSAQPHQQTFETDDLRVVFELGLVRIFSRGKNATKKLTDIGSAVTTSCTEILRINSFTRAGYRAVLKKTFPSAAEALQVLDFLAPPEPKMDPKFRRIGFTVSNRLEDENRGLFATAKVEEQEVNINMPWEALPYSQAAKSKNWIGVLDCDYYTLGPTDRDVFNTETWLRYADKTIRQYWESYSA